MAKYEDWNLAIIEFYTGNITRSAPVYLSFNDDALKYIGNSYLGIEISQSTEDFINAVKKKCTRDNSTGRVLDLSGVTGKYEDEIPLCAGFLAMMVLAAHRMSGQDDIDPSNYFRRFNSLVDVPVSQGSRPRGMATGEEEGLWQDWNKWLEMNGLISTAERGSEGSLKYLHYTLEQSLLREDDKAYLIRKFIEKFSNDPYYQSLDEGQLSVWLSQQKYGRRHLQLGFNSSDHRRLSAFYDAAYIVYQTIDWENYNLRRMNDVAAIARQVNCGIIRNVESFTDITYQILPRYPAQWKESKITVESPDGSQELKFFRQGLFKPLWNTFPFVEKSLSFPIDGDEFIKKMVFPKRDFWILTVDPDDPKGKLATWEKYPSLLGKKFILLVDKEAQHLIDNMDDYRNEKLLGWDRDKEIKNGGARWHEYQGCMILSMAWDCIVPGEQGSRELYESLKPREYANVGLSGGIKAPAQNAWLAGFPPILKIYGFEERFTVNILHDGNHVLERKIFVQNEFSLKDYSSASGDYLITASRGSLILANRSFKVIDWDDLACTINPAHLTCDIPGQEMFRLQGPRIVSNNT